ncbi:MAG: hypothetical protein A2X25_09595 [Chloroflexi bacterium GWB2_49_20]|nr:MAG: hypothetical protein A2X25_09595 [Chloroflexi bacterium GWB2_49_20]OGN79324.1 MAG: hypothetical protein A2X26_04430 [Chloroflexi bacterium GWC2_49_37]OGN82906.1 MAG: hypothetical protein A2X27_08265 [Chloroflexi bacterium GWD2_49_16]HCC78560.1 hypothetical protein [Anaerolineae bacterium]
MSKVFLSHSAIDKPFVRRFDQALRGFGIDTFLDERDITIGQDIPQALFIEIEKASHFLYFISKASIQSQWVQEELSLAKMREKSKRGMRVLPILIEDVKPPSSLISKRYADFRNKKINVRSTQFQLVLKAIGYESPSQIVDDAKATDEDDLNYSISLALLTTADLQVVLSDIVFLLLLSAESKSTESLSLLHSNVKLEISYRQIPQRFQGLFENLDALNSLSVIEPFRKDIRKKAIPFLQDINTILSYSYNSFPMIEKLHEIAENSRYLQRRIGQLHFQLLVLYV